MTGHLELMSKQRLIAIIHGQENTIRALRATLTGTPTIRPSRAIPEPDRDHLADLINQRDREIRNLRARVKALSPDLTPEEVTAEAQAILDRLPIDPDAHEHLAALAVAAQHAPNGSRRAA